MSRKWAKPSLSVCLLLHVHRLGYHEDETILKQSYHEGWELPVPIPGRESAVKLCLRTVIFWGPKYVQVPLTYSIQVLYSSVSISISHCLGSISFLCQEKNFYLCIYFCQLPLIHFTSFQSLFCLTDLRFQIQMPGSVAPCFLHSHRPTRGERGRSCYLHE